MLFCRKGSHGAKAKKLTQKGGKESCMWCVHIWRKIFPILTGDTHSKTGGPARLPTQVAGRWGHTNWISVRWGKKYFVLGWPEQPRQDKKSLVQARRAQRRTPFICTLWVPIHLSFNNQQGPPLSTVVSLILKLKLESQATALIELMLADILLRLNRLGCGEGYTTFLTTWWKFCTFCKLLSQKALIKAQ